jgi:flagellar hook assembly protein FlgD
VPQSFVLRQNYPNPFNPSTTIQYSIPSESFIKVLIYDLNGYEIITLINTRLQKGDYQITWKGRNYSNTPVPSGTYIVSIQAGDKIQSRKMILLR